MTEVAMTGATVTGTGYALASPETLPATGIRPTALGGGWKERWLIRLLSLLVHMLLLGPLLWQGAAVVRHQMTPPVVIEVASLAVSAPTPIQATPVQAAPAQTTPAREAPPPPPVPPQARPIPRLATPSPHPVAAKPVMHPHPTPAQPTPSTPPVLQSTASAAAGDVSSSPPATTVAPPPLSAGAGAGSDKAAAPSPPGYKLGAAQTPVPDYPWNARRRGHQGKVVVRMEVDAEGHPGGLHVVESSGDDELDEAALETLKRWRLRPAMADGVPVAGHLTVPIIFQLN